MAFKKGHTGNKKSTESVEKVVTPIMDNEEVVSKEEQIQNVLKAQAEAETSNKVSPSESVVEFHDEPQISRSRKAKQAVRLVAIVKKYRDKPFMSCAPYSDTKRKYLTGQEDLTPDELAKQEIIIDPNNQYPVVHMSVYDLDKPADRIMLNYFKNIEEIAPSKAKIKGGTSLFYIENREEEATAEIGFSRLVFEAMGKINNCSLSRMQDIILMLNLSGANQSITQAENLLWKECQKDPQRVLNQFLEGKEDELFLRKLIKAQILFERIGEGIYERLGEGQNMFLGKTIMEAVKFIREARNTNYVARWGQKLKEKGLK